MSNEGALARPAIGVLIDRLAIAEQVGIFVGAGVSAEAGLPSWNELVRRLLKAIAVETEAFRAARALAARAEEHNALAAAAAGFAELTIGSLGPLGAAAVVKQHLGEAYRPAVETALYENTSALSPGPTAVSIARFVLETDSERRSPILTTNYDCLLEMAFVAELRRARADESIVKTVVPGSELDPAFVNVVHLHGVIPHVHRGDPGSAEIVFAEDEFLVAGSAGNARREVAAEAFAAAPYLFLGTSMTDPNVLSYLYRYAAEGGSSRHAAVAVAQGAAQDLAPNAAQVVVDSLQQTGAARLRAAGVELVSVDTYGEASQFVRELALQRAALRAGEDARYERSERCWRRRAARLENRSLEAGLLPARGSGERFLAVQHRLQPLLGEAVMQMTMCFEDIPAFRAQDEQLALHLWAHASASGLLWMAAQSDRILMNPATLQVARTTLPTTYLVVEALCNGTVVEARDPGLRSSRWGSMVAVPFSVSMAEDTIAGLSAPLMGGVMVVASTNVAAAGLSRLRARPEERIPLLAAIARLGSCVIEELLTSADLSTSAALELLEPESVTLRHGHEANQGARRIGAQTHVSGAPPELERLGRWESLIPARGPQGTANR